MSVWDRIGRAAKGFGDVALGLGRATFAPVGFVGDIATAPWNDDAEYNGMLNTLRQRFMARFASDTSAGIARIGRGVDQSTFGVDEVVASPLAKASEGWQWLYANATSQPLATGILAGRRPGEQGYNAWDLFLGVDPSRVPDAYRQAEHTSPGRAAVAKWAAQFGAVDQYDLTTAEGVNNAVKSLPAGSFASGTVDFASNVFLDPTLIAGKGVKVGVGVRTSVQRGGPAIESTLANNRTDRFLSSLFARDTPDKRMAFLAKNKAIADSRSPATPALMHLLAHAEDAEDARMILRTAMTRDPLAAQALRVRSADAAAQVDYLTETKIPLMQKMLEGETNTFQVNWGAKRIEDLQADARVAKGVAQRESMLSAISGTLERKPVVGVTQRISDHVRWDVWQPSPYNIPMRVIKSASTIRPGVVNYHDPTSWVNLQRFLDKAGIDREVKGRLLSRWAEAADKGANEAGKKAVLDLAEQAAKDALTERLGLSPKMGDILLEHGRVRRSEVFAQLTDPRYSSVTADGRHIDLIEDDGHLLRLPVLVSQLENYHPLLDLTDAERVLRRYASEVRGSEDDLEAVLDAIRRRKPVPQALAGLEEIGQAINNVWKPAQLLRLGYTVRNVTDESLRTIATHGVMSYLPMVKRSLVARHGENVTARIERNIERLERKARVGRASPVELNVLEGLKAEAGHPAPAMFGGRISIGHYRTEDLYTDHAPLRALISARDNMRQLVTDQGTLINRSRTALSDWVDVGPLEDGYRQAWTRAVNDQILTDPVARKVLEGRTDDEISAWLHSAEGKMFRNRIGIRGGDTHRWAGEVRMHVEGYLPTPELRELATRRKRMLFSDLERAVPNAAERPSVHGESLKVATRTSIAMRTLRSSVDKAMDALGAAPNDVLVRHPFAELSYRKKLSQLIEDYDPGHKGIIDEDTLRTLQDRARTHALRQTRETMYELTEQPNISRAVRFMAPFYGAWFDMMQRWTRLFVEDPSRIARGLQLWNMPDRAGLIKTNEYGDEVFVIPVPDWAREHIPGAKSLGGLGFTKTSILPMTAGQNPLIPGAGYMVAIPVAQFARDRPQVADAVKFILPFGPGQDALDQFLPAWAKRVRSSASEDRQFTQTWTRIFTDMVYERNIGKIDMTDAELMAESKRRAKAFYNLRTFVNLSFPAIPQYQSPYQFYIDKAKAYRDRFGSDGGPDGQSWESMFIRDFGEEYWPYTLSQSKAAVAVAPTVKGYKAFEQFKDLISRYPDYAGLFIGDDAGNGTFSRAVYEWQFRADAGVGTTEKIRKALDPAAAMRELNTSQGWEKWNLATRWFDQQLVARGLSTMSAAGAEDLAQLKRSVTKALATAYPDWYRDFTTYDTEKAANVIAAVKATMNDPRLRDAPGWASLRDYVATRDKILEVLQTREAQGGSANLQAKTNADLAALFEAYTTNLRATDLSFGSLYSRWLSNDLGRNPREEELKATVAAQQGGAV